MKKKKVLLIFLPGIILGLFLSFTVKKTFTLTSTDKYCSSCHNHPKATQSWEQSVHYNNKSGIKVHCVQCHLPPKEKGRFMAKIKIGSSHLWSHLFKDSANFNWEEKSKPENAVNHVYETSCINCHQTLLPNSSNKRREKAHLYYFDKKKTGDIQCINCHITVGHKKPK